MPPGKVGAKQPDGGDANILAEVEAQIEGKVKPPPMPSPPQRIHMDTMPLVDIACVYLNDRSGWPDFKRALTECGQGYVSGDICLKGMSPYVT